MLSKNITVVICCIIVCMSVIFGSYSFINSKRVNPSMTNQMKYSDLRGSTKKQVECLATNIYREAAFEPREGWVAVGMVTMNRLNSGDHANSVCDVVYQKTGGTYQFSWVGYKQLPAMNLNIYQNILELATLIYMNAEKMHDPTQGSTFYHADYIPNPGWEKRLVKTTKIGRHIFYKKPIKKYI